MDIYTGLKDAAKVLREADKIEQYKQILDALEKMLEMQKKILDLESEVGSLQSKLETKEKLKFDKNTYWIEKDGKDDGPFCTRCWDSDKQMIRMQPCGHPDYYSCPNCKNKTVQVYSNHQSPYIKRGPPNNFR